MSFVDQVVILASSGDTAALRELLTTEATRYSMPGPVSMLSLDIEAAREELRTMPWGERINHPQRTLMYACPHDVIDAFGFCSCGFDLRMLGVDQ